MRKLLFFLAIAFCTSVFADELADANKLIDARSYAQGIALLTKLSDGGNSNAQLRLGQVYWYGEGVPVDRARGDALFAKAAAGGNADARIAMGMTAARSQHMQDIAYWTTNYDGADLTSGQYACKAPEFPAKSTTRGEVLATSKAMNDWRACYNGFVRNLDDAMPAGKRIPVDIADLMTDQEMNQARAHLDQVYSRVAANSKAGADRTLAAYGSWHNETMAYMRQKNIEAEHLARDDEILQQNFSRQVVPPTIKMAPGGK
jgi:TPR repeat protein